MRVVNCIGSHAPLKFGVLEDELVILLFENSWVFFFLHETVHTTKNECVPDRPSLLTNWFQRTEIDIIVFFNQVIFLYLLQISLSLNMWNWHLKLWCQYLNLRALEQRLVRELSHINVIILVLQNVVHILVH